VVPTPVRSQGLERRGEKKPTTPSSTGSPSSSRRTIQAARRRSGTRSSCPASGSTRRPHHLW